MSSFRNTIMSESKRIVYKMSVNNTCFLFQNGTLLLSQLLHEEPVQKLKCKSYESPRYLGMAEQVIL